MLRGSLATMSGRHNKSIPTEMLVAVAIEMKVKISAYCFPFLLPISLIESNEQPRED